MILLVSAAWRTCCNQPRHKAASRPSRERERRSQKRSFLDVGFDPLGSPPRQIIAQTRPEAGAASQASPGLDLRSGRSFVSHYVQPPVPPESTSWPFPAMLDGAVPIWSRRPSASTPARTHGILRGMTAWRAPCLEQAGARLVSQPPAPGLSSSRWTGPQPMIGAACA